MDEINIKDKISSDSEKDKEEELNKSKEIIKQDSNLIKSNKKHRKKKYNKNNKSQLRNELQYLEIITNKKKWKYSLKYFKENKNRIYYNCFDSKCKAKGIYNYENEPNDKNIINKEKNINNNFVLSKEHTITYEDHNYNKIDTIINLLSYPDTGMNHK